MSRLRLLSWLAGLGLIAALVVHAGPADVGSALALAGWGVLAVVPAWLTALLADTLGWRSLLPAAGRAGIPRLLVLRWIGASVNALLPVAQVGGEVVRARLLARHGERGAVAGAVAGASVVVDLTLGLATLVLFALGGLALLLVRVGDVGGSGILLGGLALAGLLLAGFVLAQRRGLFLVLAHGLERLGRERAWLRLAGGAAALDQEVRRLYRARRRLATAAAFRLTGWLAGSLEIWLACTLLGAPIGLVEAVILESLGQAARSAGFVVPGGLGAQESGLVVVALWLGLAPEVALAAALIKRAREIALGAVGLLVWWAGEGAALRDPSDETPMAESRAKP